MEQEKQLPGQQTEYQRPCECHLKVHIDMDDTCLWKMKPNGYSGGAGSGTPGQSEFVQAILSGRGRMRSKGEMNGLPGDATMLSDLKKMLNQQPGVMPPADGRV